MPCSACSASPRRNARVSIHADQRLQPASRRTTSPSPTRARQPPAHREVASTCSGHAAFRIAGDGFACGPSKLFPANQRSFISCPDRDDRPASSHVLVNGFVDRDHRVNPSGAFEFQPRVAMIARAVALAPPHALRPTRLHMNLVGRSASHLCLSSRDERCACLIGRPR